MSCTKTFSIHSFTSSQIENLEKFEAQTKTPKYNNTQITSDQSESPARQGFVDLFSSDAAIRSTGVKAIKDSLENRFDILAKTKTALNGSSAVSKVLRILDSEDKYDTDKKINSAIAVEAVYAQLETEPDLINKSGLPARAITNTTIASQLKRMKNTTSAVRLAGVIGKAINKARNIQVKGIRQLTEEEYAKQGYEVLNQLVEDGIIEILPNEPWVAAGIRTNDGDSVNNVQIGDIVKFRNGVFNGKASKDNSKLTPNGLDAKDLLRKVTHELMNILSKQQEGNVLSEPRTVQYENQQIGLNDQMEQAVNYLQEGGFKLGKDVQPIMEQLSKLYDKVYKDGRNPSFKEELKDIIGRDYGGDFMQQVFGIYPKHFKNISSKSDQGRETTSFGPMLTMIQNYKSMDPNEFYYTYFFAGNTRLFLDQTALQFQSNKRMDRHMIQAATEETYTGAEIDELVGRITAEYKLSRNIIKNNVAGSDTLEAALMLLSHARTAKSDSSAHLDAMAYMVENVGTLGIDSDSVWETQSILSAILDIREGIASKSEEVKTSFIMESDATASGVILKLFQNIHLPSVQAMLSRMGLGLDQEALTAYKNGTTPDSIKALNEELDTYIKDAYAPAQETIKGQREALSSSLDSFGTNEDGQLDVAKQLATEALSKTQKKSIELLDGLTDVMNKEGRNLLKMVIMKFSYHQSSKNNAQALGEDLAVELIDHGDNWEGVNKVAKLYDLGVEYSAPLSFAEQEEAFGLIANAISETTGHYLVKNIIEPTYQENFKAAEADASMLVKAISELKPRRSKDKSGKLTDNLVVEGSVNIASPLHVVNNILNGIKGKLDKTTAPLDKKRETLIDNTDPEKAPTLMSLQHFNELSAHVLPIHMIDAAVLVMSIEEVYTKLRKEAHIAKVKDFMQKNPMAPIHDAIMMPSKHLLAFEEAYERNILKVSYHYDINSQLVAEYESKLNANNTDVNQVQDLPADIQTIKDRTAENFKARQKYLEQFKNDKGEFTGVMIGSFRTDLTEDTLSRKDANSEVEAAKNRKVVEKKEDTKKVKEDVKPTEDVKPYTAEEKAEVDAIFAPASAKTFLETVDGLIGDTKLDEVHQEMLTEIKTFVNNSSEIEFNTNIESLYSVKDGSETITVGKDLIGSKLVEELHHEITHAKTAAYIIENPNNNAVKYLTRALPLLSKKLAQVKDTKKYAKQIDRITGYATEAGDKALNKLVSTAEFVAIMNSEPEIAEGVYELLREDEGTHIIKRVKDAMAAIKKAIKSLVGITAEQYKVLDETGIVSSTVLMRSVQLVVHEGSEKRKKSSTEEKKEAAKTVEKVTSTLAADSQNTFRIPMPKYKEATPHSELNDPLTQFITDSNGYVADLVNSGYYTSKPFVTETAINVHNFMSEESQLYRKTADQLSGIWEGNAQVQAIRSYTGKITELKSQLNKLLAIQSNTHKTMMTTMDNLVIEFEREISAAGFKTEEQLNELNTVFAKSGIFSIFRNGMLKRLTSGESLTKLIEEAEATVRREGGQLGHALKLSQLYLDKPTAGEHFNNIEGYGARRDTAKYKAYEELVALYALSQTSGSVKLLRSMSKDPSKQDVYFKLLESLQQVKAYDNDLHSAKHGTSGSDVNISRGNLIDDVAKSDNQIIAIAEADLADGKLLLPENGWKILRQPNEAHGKLGLIYRENTRTLSEGLVNASYIKTGIIIDENKRTKIYLTGTNQGVNPIVLSRSVDGQQTTRSLVLTPEEKSVLGYYNNPAQSLMRAYAHKEMLLKTQVIRQSMLDGFTAKFSRSETLNRDITKSIKADDYKVFIKAPKGLHPMSKRATGEVDVNGNDILEFVFSKDIRNKYQLIDKTLLSDVGNFKNQVDWVRKDVAHIATGFTDGDLFKKHNWNVWHSRLKDVVRYGKQVQIILNVPKIAMDFTMGMGVATAKGASIQEIWTYAREAIDGSQRMSALLNQETDLKFQLALYSGRENLNTQETTKKTTLERRAARIAHLIETDSFGPAIQRGFVQSLGTDIISRDRESIKGLQVNMEKLVSKFTKNDRGELTEFNRQVKRLANFGGDKFGMDVFYAGLSDKLNAVGVAKAPATLLKQMGEDLKAIKSEEDMTKYITELMAAPNSSVVRFGAAMTVYADLLPRWIIYRHNKNTGMSENDAIDDALGSLPNYLEGMPSSLKGMSDIYFMPYPSFWTRTFIIARELARRSPISLSGQMAGAFLLETQGAVHMSGINKIIGDGAIISSPFELPLVPYSNLLG